MKILKLLGALICTAVFISLSPCVSAVQGEVYLDDRADLYSEGEETYILSLMENAAEKTDWNYGIVTLNEDINDSVSACSRAERLYDERFGADSSGVLYMCDVGYRWFVIAGNAENYVSGSRYDRMEKKIKELYFDYKDIECAEAFINTTSECFDKGAVGFEPNGAGIAWGTGLAFFAAAAAVIVVNVRYKKYPKAEVNNYLDPKRTNMYRRNDIFAREYTTKHTHSSSSGGGSGGHHGGGGFGGHR